MNFVRIHLPHDQVPKFIPVATFTGAHAEYNATKYARKVGWEHKVTTYRDVLKDGTTWAVYVDEKREATGSDFYNGAGTIHTPHDAEQAPLSPAA